MRKFVTSAIAALAAGATSFGAMAAEWTPPGPIKMMIAFRAGGGADTQARLIAEELEARHGWKVIPEQVTGKGGLNLVRALQGQPTDGTVIGMLVTESIGYNMRAADAGMTPSDVTPIVTTAGFQMGVVALSSKGWNTLGEVIELAKGGEAIRFGVMSPRLADLAYVIGKENGVDFNIVSVRGGKAVMDGLNAGDMDIGFGAGIQTKAVLAGDMVNLASAISKPLDASPDAPLLSDYNVPFNGEGLFMYGGPAGMDPAAREAIAAAITEIVTDPATKANAIITKAFGGPIAVSGAALDTIVSDGWDDAGALLDASAE